MSYELGLLEGQYALEHAQRIDGIPGVVGARFIVTCDQATLPNGTRDSFLEYEVMLKFLQNYTGWLKYCRDTGLKTF